MKKIIILLCLFTAIIVNTSCEDQLNALPTQSKVDDNLIVDQKSAEVALNGVYYTYAMCGNDYYDVPSTMCFLEYELYPAMLSGLVGYYQGGTLQSHTVTAEDYYTSNLWSGYYKTLAAANGLIDQIRNKPDEWFSGSRKAEITGEASFIRALTHYNLMRHFAHYFDIDSPYGVLLRTEALKTSNISKSRSSVKESYDTILEDIETAIENCPTTSNNFYVNKWVAKGLKVRVLMMRGATGDYAEAASIAQDIIQYGPYTLENSLKTLFREKGLVSSEVMFAIKPKPDQNYKWSTYYYSNRVEYLATTTLKNLLENDPRVEWMIGTDGGDGSTLEDVMGSDRVGITKYGQLGSSNANWEINYQMRLSEIYLLRAEALVRSGGNKTEAKNLLKTIMGKAGITDFSAVDAAVTDEAILTQIFFEMEKNLVCECGQELDIQLRMPVAAVQTVNPAIGAKNYMILPIPADEFRKNPAIGEQNPGYTKE
ncbi:MAG: RagB/SusD family nutrient uptake outer membrane protein [Bacteroidales bacterium]|nr:RagB/SusD family nutrient uptake outer membrane protein [Bacteroidales bacterium]MDD2424435.1 RagB/SusD family nutrient uptake outer membrane protein [Bacteroidales bacterium]MDD3990241.1 RagB/SusD family nutrient uptake outer membrane protein [Bacteroidales bacterium]